MSKRLKLLFLTDSLGLPRRQPESVVDHNTWPYRTAIELRDSFDAYFYLFAGLHTRMAVAHLRNQLGAFTPDCLVLQIGIVDCAPRAITEMERRILDHAPGFFSRPLHRLVRRNYSRLIRARRLAYVPSEEFRHNLTTLRDYFSAANFLVVPIGPANAQYQKQNPLLAEAIHKYNAILGEVFADGLLSDTYSDTDPESLFMSDNHHLSLEGHRVVATAVQRRLQLMLRQRSAPELRHDTHEVQPA